MGLGLGTSERRESDLPARSSSEARFFPRRPTVPSLPGNRDGRACPIAEACSLRVRSSSRCCILSFFASSKRYLRCASTYSASSRAFGPGTNAVRVSIALSTLRGEGDPSDESPSAAYSLSVLSSGGPRARRDFLFFFGARGGAPSEAAVPALLVPTPSATTGAVAITSTLPTGRMIRWPEGLPRRAHARGRRA